MKGHVLKCDTGPFDAIWRERKLFEYRRNDRQFAVGDRLTLNEIGGVYSRQIIAEVTFVLRGPDFGVPLGYCVMSLDPRTMRRIH